MGTNVLLNVVARKGAQGWSSEEVGARSFTELLSERELTDPAEGGWAWVVDRLCHVTDLLKLVLLQADPTKSLSAVANNPVTRKPLGKGQSLTCCSF